MYSCCFRLLPFLPPLTHPIFGLSFFTQGENEEEQNQHMKTKTWQRGEGWGGEGEGGRQGGGGGTEEGEAISENKRAFKSKGWKLVRLLFLKNDPCVVLLLRARYILFYLPEETQQGVLATKKNKKNSPMASFKLCNLLSLMWILTGIFHITYQLLLCELFSQISGVNYIRR